MRLIMVFNQTRRMLLAILVAATSSASYSQEISGTDILNLLVEQGVLTQDAAQKLIEKVRMRNEKAAQIEEQKVPPAGGEVRVPFVPGYVKKEIEHGVAAEVRGQVLEDIVAQARTERWNVPGSQPRWTDKIKITGDARLRAQADLYDSDNPAAPGADIYDLNTINDAGRRTGRDQYINVVDDQYRLRGRFRLMMQAKPTEGVEIGMRLTTGNQGVPGSANQTLGNYGGKWDTNFDLAYIKYNDVAKSITLQGGKIKNPFLHTDLVWDDDLTFEGVAGIWNPLRSIDLEDDDRQWDPFVTLGAFPLQHVNVVRLPTDKQKSPGDKWLYAAQFGTHYKWWSQSELSVALSYYHYENITGTVNELNSDLQNATSAPYLQYGNAVYDISTTTDGTDELYGLASKYHLAGLTMVYDYAGFAPYHAIVTADYIKNIAFDSKEITDKTGDLPSDFPTRDVGYQFGVKVGWPNLNLRGNWDVSFVYRRLEGDAVVDAFADSDFLLGGTNARGYIIKGDYALMDDVYASLRWISAEELDTAVSNSVAVDRLFLDLGAKF